MRRFSGPAGSITRVMVESKVLQGNLLGDPPVRVVDLYVPAGHDGRGLPLLVDLVGFTGSGLSHTNWIGFRENVPERPVPSTTRSSRLPLLNLALRRTAVRSESE